MKIPEIRFTRSAQALHFLAAGLALLGLSVVLFALWLLNESLRPAWWWCLVPLGLALLCGWVARHLARHEYLLFSAIGLEIFPFYRPSHTMQLVSWGEIADARVTGDRQWLALSMAGYEDRKILITLAPIARKSLPLLERTVHGVMDKRREMAAAHAVSGM